MGGRVGLMGECERTSLQNMGDPQGSLNKRPRAPLTPCPRLTNILDEMGVYVWAWRAPPEAGEET